MNCDEIPVGRAEDLRGQKFGKLTVLYRIANRGTRVCWKCQCDCGNTHEACAFDLKRKHVLSCGCKYQEKIKDMTGQKFGKLTVLRPLPERAGNRQVIWECQCECGTIIKVRGDGLRTGRVVTCGSAVCRGTEKDMIGLKFGKLTVISKSNYKRENDNHTFWNCKCECGNTCMVCGQNLRNGNTTSCGCIVSRGEQLIGNIFEKENIIYQTQKTFDTCRFIDTKALAKFDFYVNNYYLIEYDGKQHYEATGGWNTEFQLSKTQEHDVYKNQWCKENNIPLIRIPYTKINTLTIEDLMLETTQFRVV
jgi:hypothetical protein